MSSIGEKLASFQSNCWPAMLEDLGRSLGVSADSLRRLALGWVPIVEFRKGPSFCGWFVIPERNADGVPTGLGLRNQNGDKFNYPGSKHGLIYEINPEHERGGMSSDPGRWIRTTAAGVPCPVCGKGDGCLVNADRPDDPKGDAVCIRHKVPVRSGDTVRPMKFGYLHSSRQWSAGASALANNGGPVLVVEGMSDAAAAMDLGFDAVGRPSNLAGLDILCDLIRGREVIIVGENDRKSDGRMPGREGMIAAFQAVRRVCKKPTMLMPPEHVKDLRAWVVRCKLTREAFLEHHEKHKLTEVPGTVLPKAEPGTVASAFLNDCFTVDGKCTLLRWAGTYYVNDSSGYRELEDDALIAQMQRWAEEKTYIESTSKGEVIKPLVAKTGTIRDWLQALLRHVLLPKTVVPPAWVNGAEGSNPRDLVVFRNCVTDVSGFARGGEIKRLAPTPDFFTLSGLSYDFDEEAECPTWRSYLESTLGDDPDKIKLLQEWFGYCLIPDTTYQTFAYFYGGSGSGKGTAARVLRLMLGSQNCASTTMAALSGRFGLEPLLGKLLCILPDARLSARSDALIGLEKILNLTGEDACNVDRKSKTELTINALTARIMFVSNELISLPDREHATARRIRVIHFARDFRANPDRTLIDRISIEVAGIAVWALEGLKRLRRQGHFTEPASSQQAARDWAIRTSEAAAFIDENCLIASNAHITEDELYDAAVKWNEGKDEWNRSKRQLVRSLRIACPSLRYTKLPTGRAVYRGLTLTPDSARRLLGRPVGDSTRSWK